MKFSKQTLMILKNFSGISEHIWFRTEGQLATVNKQHYNIIAVANITDEIPQEFGIFELSRLLSVLSLFDPETYNIEIEDRVLVITEGEKQKLKYTTASKKVLDLGPRNHPEIKGAKMPDDILASFVMTNVALKKTLQVSSAMNTFNRVSIKGENGLITINAWDVKDPTTDVYTYQVGETDQKFETSFASELFQKLMEGDSYNVRVAKDIAEFAGTYVTYYLRAEAN